MMDFFDTKTLKKDKNQDGLFNFFQPTFKMLTDVDQQLIVVDKDSAMRIDLVCNELYKRVDLIDFLCSFNDIDNPLNVMEGDILFYTSFATIDTFRIKKSETDETRTLLLNPNKASQVDSNRQKYVEDKYSLPPTVMPVPKPHIKIERDNFIIGER